MHAVALMAEGERLFAEVQGVAQEVAEQLLSDLSRDEREELFSLLRRFVEGDWA